MLKVDYTKLSSKSVLESKVKVLISQTVKLWDELEDFERVFEIHIDKMPKHNHISAKHAFRLKASGTNALSVWHYTPEGDPDRLIATIRHIQE